MIRKAKAVWRGTGRAGNGNLSTDSGVLANTPYSFKTRFENEKGTNPEELIAAAHAGCFTMALAFGMQGAGFTPTELSTEAAVTLEPEGQGFRISRSALTLRAKVPNLVHRPSRSVDCAACLGPAMLAIRRRRLRSHHDYTATTPGYGTLREFSRLPKSDAIGGKDGVIGRRSCG